MYEKSYSSDMAAAASQYYKERKYWLEKFSGNPIKSTFPIDYRISGKQIEMTTALIPLSGKVTEKLLWMSNESDSRLLIMLITGLIVLVQKYTAEDDILIGTPIYKQQVEGKFLNTVLPLRNKVHEKLSFKQLLYLVKQTLSEAVEHQNYPLRSLLYELNLPYSEDDFPLFDIALILENIQDRKYIQHIYTNMIFSFARVGNKIDGRLEYNGRFYDSETAERIGRYFNRLLEQVLFHVDTPLDQVDLLSPEEKKILVEDFNNTRREESGTHDLYQSDKMLHMLFEEQVEQTPDQTAIIFVGKGEETLTYRQLNKRADQLAQLLRKKGIGPECIVGLLLESSIPMVTAVLAVLKAGGAYLPIDLEAPLGRKTYMLMDSRAHLLLTGRTGESTGEVNIETLNVSEKSLYNTDTDASPLEHINKSSDLAYIIYTSGSTGKPKGVMVEHRHVVNTLVYRKEEYVLDSSHTALQLFSYAFDGFLTSFFTPLISGTRVVILGKQTLEDITRLTEVIAHQRVTHFISVPILFQAIMNTITTEQASTLQVVTLAGDRVQPHLLELAAQKNKNIEIVNEYGITEAAVMSTVFRHQEKDSRIKIGFPSGNTRIYITRSPDGEDLQLQPIGVYGEMCIAGAGVARGYMNKPALTASKFTTDHLMHDLLRGTANDKDGYNRMFRTCDMARRLPDGNIEFCGRTDFQVKIRGYRIEPGEIENLLKRHTRIKEAVVVAHENQNNKTDKYLCAYYVEKNNKPPELWPSTAEFFVYDELLYYAMTNDEHRNASYRYAINKLVKDKVVVEVGTGQDAVLAKFCVEAGARKVYAIELMEESYKKAADSIRRAGMERTIVLIHGDATKVILPEKADVCLSEIVGAIGGCEGAAVILNNARRFLKEDGIMVPWKSITKIAAMHLPDSLHQQPRFTNTPGNYSEKIFQSLGYSFDLRVCVRNLPQSAIISSQGVFEYLDFSAPVDEEGVESINLIINKNSRMDGFLVWLNLHTVEEEVIDILEQEFCWLPVFVPVFYPGINVSAGDRIEAQCIRTLSENNINPDFKITGQLRRANGETVAFDYELPHFEKRYKSNSFYAKLFENPEFVDVSTGNNLSAGELHDYLARELPSYMVPTYFVPMEHIPLNTNGKIDRRSLPKPKEGSNGENYLPPRDKVETTLVEIWQDVLGIEKIGINDNFFNLGGHSLTATMLASRIHKIFNVKMALTKIFGTPTIEGIADFIKETMDKPENAKDSFDTIEPAAEQPYYPLSPAQNRLYFLYRLEEAGRGYNMSQAVILEGVLDVNKLETVFFRMVERHESLRTSFLMKEGMPVQVIHQDVDFKIEYIENPESSNTYQDMVLSFIRPFDLALAPLMRVGLVTFNEDKHLLLLDMHHIISDGTSLGIMIKEFALLYKGENLPPLRIGYKDYALWLTHPHSRALIKNQEDYWNRTFSGEVPVLDLPTDFPRPAIKSFQGSILEFSFNQEETSKIKTVAEKVDATLYMAVLSLFTILLSKLSGQEDIVIGTPTAGRRHTDVENIVGMFVNTLALRNYPSAGKNFLEFLKEVKTSTLGAFENQEYPFEDLVDRVAIRRDTGRNPVFDVMFALQNMDMAPGEITGLKLIPCDYETGISKFDLNLNGFEERERLYFSFEYSTALFTEETIRRFIGYFRELVSSVSADPHQTISHIEILTDREREQVLYEFNNTEADFPADKTIHELFEDQAAKSPNAIALIAASSNTMTYEQLNQESSQMASVLYEEGVTTGSIVAVMLERTPEMAVALLGILKVGGAYLPIDPQYPEERKQHMITDSGAKILVKKSEIRNWDLNSSLPTPHSQQPVTNSSNPAYVVYTSGTTGVPKGVVVSHRNIINGLWFRKEEYGFDETDVCLQLFSYSFDGFVTSFFTPLISGAAVVLLNEEQLGDIGRIKEAIVENKVTHFICVPPLYHAIIEALSPEEAISLRIVTLAGDKISPKTLAATLKKNPSLEIANEYGVTEASVVSSIYRHQEENDIIKIGKPISNTHIFILNSAGGPQPVGVPGELCIGGIGVTSGYLGNPQLTAERFTPLPLYPSTPLYHTGDLARWLPDGNIQLLGRLDFQLKIRGFRIEAGEIEARLLERDGIKEALVIARGDAGGDKYLCAYLVVYDEQDPQELKDYLQQRLPVFMVPSYFITIDKLPLTPNGKLDRKALPEPEIKTGRDYAAPGNENEEKLVDIWADVLGLGKEKIGVNDNFFDLGGNSLKVMQVNAKLKETFHRNIPVVAMFQHTSISAFARYLNPEFTPADIQSQRTQQERDVAIDKGKNKLKNLKRKMKERKND